MDAPTRLGPRWPPGHRPCGAGAGTGYDGWIGLYETIGNAGIVCRCGISRPTLRKWWQRYRSDGVAGLKTRSSRPHCSPGRRVFQQDEALILEPRSGRRLGIKRLRNELIREHALKLALDTIHKVLIRHGERYLSAGRYDATLASATAGPFRATGCRPTSARSCPSSTSTPRSTTARGSRWPEPIPAALPPIRSTS
jgi:transposase-like protein